MSLIDSKLALDKRLWQSPIVRRPLTPACWRETGYLILAFITGTIGFTFLVSAASTAFGLAVVIIGIPDRGAGGARRPVVVRDGAIPVRARTRPADLRPVPAATR